MSNESRVNLVKEWNMQIGDLFHINGIACRITSCKADGCFSAVPVVHPDKVISEITFCSPDGKSTHLTDFGHIIITEDFLFVNNFVASNHGGAELRSKNGKVITRIESQVNGNFRVVIKSAHTEEILAIIPDVLCVNELQHYLRAFGYSAWADNFKVDEYQERKRRGRPRNEDSDKETRMTFIVDKTQLEKIREIGYRERKFTKEILYKALEDLISDYEARNGEVIPKRKSKLDED